MLCSVQYRHSQYECQKNSLLRKPSERSKARARPLSLLRNRPTKETELGDLTYCTRTVPLLTIPFERENEEEKRKKTKRKPWVNPSLVFGSFCQGKRSHTRYRQKQPEHRDEKKFALAKFSVHIWAPTPNSDSNTGIRVLWANTVPYHRILVSCIIPSKKDLSPDSEILCQAGGKGRFWLSR